jgi:hypothetical protein
MIEENNAEIADQNVGCLRRGGRSFAAVRP